MPWNDTQNLFCINKKIRPADNTTFSFSSQTGLDCAGVSCSLVGIHIPGRMLGNKSKPNHERRFYSVPCACSATPLILAVLLFSFQSWNGEDPAFGGVRRSALALAVCLTSIQLEDQRRGNTVKFVSALGISIAGLLNLISSFWCWHCSVEQGPKTNLILLWNRVAKLDERYSQWAVIH